MPAAYLKLMRPSDWVKNILVLAALVFGEKLGDSSLWWPTAAAFAAFCCMASGLYALNDVRDAANDRLHPMKRHRPVASGAVTPGSATAFGAGLVLVGLAIASLVNYRLLAVCGAYVLLQIAYNLRLKRVQLIDVSTIAVGFVLRAAAGAAAINIGVSIYLVLCVFFLCLYLGFIKRMCDLASAMPETAGDVSATGWTPPAHYTDKAQLNWMLAVSASLVIGTYVSYTLADHTRLIFGPRAMGFTLMSPLVLIAVHRFYLRANQGKSDRPTDALIEDRGLQASVGLFIVGVIVTLYAPGVDRVLAGLFVNE